MMSFQELHNLFQGTANSSPSRKSHVRATAQRPKGMHCSGNSKYHNRMKQSGIVGTVPPKQRRTVWHQPIPEGEICIRNANPVK